MLTETQISKLTKPGDYSAGGVPGLALRVYESGKRSWLIRYSHGPRSRKMILGDATALNLKEARKLAAETYGGILRGRDPLAERKERRQAAKVAKAPIKDKIERIAKRYIQEYAAPRTRMSTCAETWRILRVDVVPAWRGRRMSEITKQDIRQLLAGIVARGAPIQANRTLAMLSGFFNWAVREDILAVSPCNGIVPPGVERARDRALDDSELAAVWQAAQELGEPFAGVLHMLILTGARLNEIGRMTWQEIDFDRKVWTLPASRAKNGRALALPLSDQALAILESQPHDSEFVFAVDGRPISNWSRPKRRLDELAGLASAFVIHDLRRSAVTGLAALGVALPVIEKIANHASGSFRGIVSTYQRYSFEPEMRAALQLWADHVTPVEPLALAA